jgi:putative DNA primase/helicase
MSFDFSTGALNRETDRNKTVYCDCPSCGYKNALAITRTGERMLYHCHAGCSQEILWKAISQREPKDAAPLIVTSRRSSGSEEYARLLWSRSLPATASVVERYLNERELSGLLPAALRYLPEHVHAPTETKWPVMLASVVDNAGGIKAVHRTYLSEDGCRKAPVQPPRMTLGLISGFACHLAKAEEKLAVAEGIETGFAFQLMTGIPTWAALSAGGIRTLILPPLPAAQFVTIAADADKPGIRAAEFAAERWRAEGREVRIMVPPRPGLDFNDLLIGAKL